jgi:hypothetical protein
MCISLHVKYTFSCRILMKPEFSRQIFYKYSKILLYDSPSNGSLFVPYGRADTQTDGHDEADSRFSQFYEST